MSNKFLNPGGSMNLSNGTANIFASELGAISLDPSQPIKTNSVRQLVSTKLDISDVNNLSSELNTKNELSFIGNDTHTNPTAGQVKLYAKTDGNFYKKDSAGNESILGGTSEKLILVEKTTDIDYSEEVKSFTYSDNTLNTHNFYDYTSIPFKPELRQAFEPTDAATNVTSEAELDSAIAAQAKNIVLTVSFSITTQKIIAHSCKISQSVGLTFTSSIDMPFMIQVDNVTIDGLSIINSGTSSIVNCLYFNSTTAINNTVRNCIFTTNEFAIASNNAQIQIHNCQFKFTGTADSHRYINLTKTTGKTLIYSNTFESNGAFSTACLLLNGFGINYKDGSLIVYNNTSSNGTIQRMGIMEVIPDGNFTLSFIENTIQTFTDFFILYVGSNPLAGFKEIILHKNNVTLDPASTGFKGLIGIDSSTTGNTISTSTIIRASQNTLPTTFRPDYAFIPKSSASNPLMMYRPDKFNLTIPNILINPPLVSYEEGTNVTELQNKTQNITSATSVAPFITNFQGNIRVDGKTLVADNTTLPSKINGIARYSTTTGGEIKDSPTLVDDTGNMIFPASAYCSVNVLKCAYIDPELGYTGNLFVGQAGGFQNVKLYAVNTITLQTNGSNPTLKLNTDGTIQLDRAGVYDGTTDAILKLNTNGTLEKSNATVSTTGDFSTTGYVNATQFREGGNIGAIFRNPSADNYFIGNGAGNFYNSGTSNLFIGSDAGRDCNNSVQNIGIGFEALKYSQSTNNNQAIGNQSQLGVSATTTGNFNTSMGTTSLYSITSGSNNVAIGGNAGFTISTGNNNTCIGGSSGSNANMTNSTSLGFNALPNGGTNRTAIGYLSSCDADNQISLGNNGTTQIINTGNTVCDLGSLTHQFKDIYFSGNLYDNGALVSTPVNVICKYYSSSTTGNGDIILQNKLIDTHNAYNTVNGKYTVPVTGNYYVSGLFQSPNINYGVNGWLELYVNYNNTGQLSYNLLNGNRAETAGAIYRYVQGSSVFPLNAGDTIALYKNAAVAAAPINCILTITKI